MRACPLQIGFLGEFSIVRDGRALSGPKAKKARVLVAHLALHAGHVLLRDDLGAHLWPDSDIDVARFNLRQLIARIRREAPDLSPHIVAEDRRTLKFDPEGAEIDVVEFMRLIQSAPDRAVHYYRGPLLADIDDAWIEIPRAECEELYLRALESLADASDPREAVRWLRMALETDPYREPVQQKLLSRLAECGDFAGVIVAFRKFQETLHRELNIEPSSDTERLYRQLVSRAASPSEREIPSPILRSRVPVPASPVLGRAREIDDVCALLGTARLVTLLGPGGAGKTRLSIAIAERELKRRTDGVWFVDFSSATDPVRVPQTVGQSLGLRGPIGTDWTEALAENMASSDRLLILDNCEHLVEACATFAETLLSRCVRLTIVATSRMPLGVSDEQRYLVPSLELPPESTNGQAPEDIDFTTFSALQLFEARAKLVLPKFAITAENARQVTAICRAVDAMPLAIEMAAARLAALPLEEVVRRLDDRLAFLRSPSRTTVPRHQTLGAVIEWSYGLLPEDAKILIRRLAVFGGGFTLAAAERVCGFGSLESPRVLESLVGLTEASLVQQRNDRYSFLETIRQFAEARLVDSDEETLARDRHLCFFSEFCSGVDGVIQTDGPDAAARHYRPELDNIRAALAWSVKGGDIERGLSLVANASVALSVVQLDGEAVAWLQRILTLGNAPSQSAARIEALRRACSLYQSNYTDVDRAVARDNTICACEELIELATRNGNRQAVADAFAHLGSICLNWDNRRGREALDRAIEITASLPEGGEAQRALWLSGRWAQYEGNFDEALSLYERAAVHAARVGDVGMTIDALETQSHLLREYCLYDQALEKLREIRRILTGWGNARASAFNDLRFAEFYLHTWDFESLIEPLSRAQGFFRESLGRFHVMLLDGLVRYVAAYDGPIADAISGQSAVVARLISDGYRTSSAAWHAACVELEALALCLARAGEPAQGAQVLGAAQSLRERDQPLVSPSTRARWARLVGEAGFNAFEAETENGRQFTPEQTLELVEDKERELLALGPRQPPPGVSK